MTVSDDIFQLIRSLSQNEKTYFKKFAQLHVLGEENNYILLFDAIDTADRYDEKSLVNQFSKGKSSSQFSGLKNYLYNLILKALRNYHADVTVRAELRQQLQNVSILFDKGLRDQAEKLLRRCRKTAEQAELFRELIEISGLEQVMLLFGASYDAVTIKETNRMLDERKLILEKMQNTYNYDRIEYNLSHLLQDGNRKSMDEAAEWMKHELLKSEKKALCVVSQLKFHHIHSTYFYYTGKLKDCIVCLQKEIEILESNPEIMQLRIQDYVLLTNNVLLLLLQLGDYKRFDVQVGKFHKKLDSIRISVRLWEQAVAHTWLIEMERHYTEDNYTGIVAAASDLKRQLKANKAELNLSDTFLFLDLLTRASFRAGKFNEALDYSIQIMNHNEAPKKFHSFNYARLMNLLVHFELGNFDLLDYQIQSFQRQVMKEERDNALYKAVIYFLKKYPSAIDKKAKRLLAEKLLKQLHPTGNSDLLKYYDLAGWAKLHT